MARLVNLIGVFISSPNDCDDEKKVISQAINEFNGQFGIEKNIFFHPIRWEKDLNKKSNNPIQENINNELLLGSDCGIVVFKSRIGGNVLNQKDSNTIAELEYFEKNNKLYIIFNSKIPLENAELNLIFNDDEKLQQLFSLRNFLQEKKNESKLISEFESYEDLKKTTKEFLSGVSKNIILKETEKKVHKAINKPTPKKTEYQDFEIKSIVNNLGGVVNTKKIKLESAKEKIINLLTSLYDSKSEEYNFKKGIDLSRIYSAIRIYMPNILKEAYGFSKLIDFLSGIFYETKFRIYRSSDEKYVSVPLVGIEGLKLGKGYEEIIPIEIPPLHSADSYLNFLKISPQINLPQPTDLKNILICIVRHRGSTILRDELTNEISKIYVNALEVNGILNLLIEKEVLQKEEFQDNEEIKQKLTITDIEVHDVLDLINDICHIRLSERIKEKIDKSILNFIIYS